jgi:RNA polymerase sigma factor (TIGR02999 family)
MTSLDITQLLIRVGDGDGLAQHELLKLVYDELHSMAAAKLGREGAAQSLTATALVNEAWLRMSPSDGSPGHWQNRKHFFGAAAEAMRRILVDQARRRHALKRAKKQLSEFDMTIITAPECPDELDLIEISEALEQLHESDPRSAKILELRFFGGLSLPDIAEVMELSRATVVRELTFAKCWIKARIDPESPKQAQE